MVLNQRMDALSLTFSALADPTRRAILSRLAIGPANVTELALPFAISQPAISKHLKILERAGLIGRSREGQARPCAIQAAPLKDVADWAATYRQHWEASFDRLDTYLEDLQKKEAPHGKRK
jgi:DNA-binding transcriptional ArsR family regulator